MPAPQTTDELITLVRKSNLLDPAKLDAFLTTQPPVGDSPKVYSDKLRANGLLTPFQSEQLMRGKHKGFFLGKYKILDRIGLGGMGQVFLAEHVSMRRRAALKVMPPDRAENQYSRERFLREARAAGQLDHPNLVRAFDVDTDHDVIFLVMEFVDGVSLETLVSRHGPLLPDRAGQYLYQAARGLEYLHKHGLIHRDIKPANMLVDRQGIVRILDLGLVRSEQEDDNLTRGEGVKILGTADYLSPEQAIDCSKVDVRTDIYSLGATAYFLLTGKPPFQSDRVTHKLLAHQLQPVVPVHEVSPAVPAELSAIVTKMLAKKPEARYQTPTELAEVLATWGEKRVALPTELEIPNTLGGVVGWKSTTSPGDSGTSSRIGGSSVSLSGSSTATGSGVRYQHDSKLVMTPRPGSDSGKAVSAPVLTPIPKPSATPLPKPKPSEPVAKVPPPPQLPYLPPIQTTPVSEPREQGYAPPPLPATVTHGSEGKSKTKSRPGVDLNFLLPPEMASINRGGSSELSAPSGSRKLLVIGFAVAAIAAVIGFILMNGLQAVGQ